ncbi:MAG: hypothetical protein EPN25_05565 [Nitrospirae bacterium]|nr:MAG: hypothetical protein EPN25_05565 [Nitrospirota bacterium]
MDEKHILNLNPQKVIRCLGPILPAAEIDKVKEVLRANIQQMLRLGLTHLRFAERAAGPSSWRQRVSRGYYCAYCTSRAVRLAINGHYSQDIGDHKKIGDLPSDFPSKATWEDFLMKFKADRNLADYDHTVSEKALELGSNIYMEKAGAFYQTARKYLIEKGAIR